MEISVYHLLEGARQARGLTVVIDVLRAFSLECYLYGKGAAGVRPVGGIEEAFALQRKYPGSLLAGERQGKKCEGFTFGNSPSAVLSEQVRGKLIFHTTSAGTQGIVHATGAEEILTGSLVNASAIAAYIRKKQPEQVSLVCMGTAGVERNAEDTLCADYIAALLRGEDFPLHERLAGLPQQAAHFFNPHTQDVFPEADYWLCTSVNRFPFVLRVEKDEDGWFTTKIPVQL